MSGSDHSQRQGGRQPPGNDIEARALRLFVSKASHELRQPLAALRLLIGELDELDDAPEIRRQVMAAITSSAAMMEEFVVAIIDFNKLLADAMEIERLAFDPDPIIDEAIAAARRIAPVTANPRRVGPTQLLLGDADAFRRILDCLLINAVRHGAGGGILVGTRARKEAIWLEVWDQGPGIAPCDIEAVFTPYYQVEKMTRAEGGGLGLGLPIARMLAEKMGGSLTVASRVGRGTVFRLKLPYAHDRGPQAASHEPAAPDKTRMERPFEGLEAALLLSDAAEEQAVAQSLSRWGAITVTLPPGLASAPPAPSPETVGLVIVDENRLAAIGGSDALGDRDVLVICDDRDRQLWPTRWMWLRRPFHPGKLRALLTDFLARRPR